VFTVLGKIFKFEMSASGNIRKNYGHVCSRDRDLEFGIED